MRRIFFSFKYPKINLFLLFFFWEIYESPKLFKISGILFYSCQFLLRLLVAFVYFIPVPNNFIDRWKEQHTVWAFIMPTGRVLLLQVSDHVSFVIVSKKRAIINFRLINSNSFFLSYNQNLIYSNDLAQHIWHS
jgi:hypothetical protein